MKLKESIIPAIFLLLVSILFVPQDRMDIVALLIATSGILGLVYWWIK